MARTPTGTPKRRTSKKTSNTKSAHFIYDFQVELGSATEEAVMADAERAFSDVTNALGILWDKKPITLRVIPCPVAPKKPDYPYHNNIVFPSGSAEPPEMVIPAAFLTEEGGGCDEDNNPAEIFGRGPTFWHGVTNVLFPANHNKTLWGKFLDVGLGGLMQWTYQPRGVARPWPEHVYPTMGTEPDILVGQYSYSPGWQLLSLSNKEVGPPALQVKRRQAWVQAISFIKYVRNSALSEWHDWHTKNTAETLSLPELALEGGFKTFFDANMTVIEPFWRASI